MKENNRTINPDKWSVKVDIKVISGNYSFFIKLISDKGKTYEFPYNELREFIDDEFGDNPKLEHLENIMSKAIKNHLEDVLKLCPYIHGNIRHWLKEAKRQIDESK